MEHHRQRQRSSAHRLPRNNTRSTRRVSRQEQRDIASDDARTGSTMLSPSGCSAFETVVPAMEFGINASAGQQPELGFSRVPSKSAAAASWWSRLSSGSGTSRSARHQCLGVARGQQGQRHRGRQRTHWLRLLRVLAMKWTSLMALRHSCREGSPHPSARCCAVNWPACRAKTSCELCRDSGAGAAGIDLVLQRGAEIQTWTTSARTAHSLLRDVDVLSGGRLEQLEVDGADQQQRAALRDRRTAHAVAARTVRALHRNHVPAATTAQA